MIDGFFELPKDKRPPENIWFDSDELETWFEEVEAERRLGKKRPEV